MYLVFLREYFSSFMGKVLDHRLQGFRCFDRICLKLMIWKILVSEFSARGFCRNFEFKKETLSVILIDIELRRILDCYGFGTLAHYEVCNMIVLFISGTRNREDCVFWYLIVFDRIFVLSGGFYGKFSGFSKHTLKTDIMNILEGCNVTPDDLKFSYMRGGNLNPSAV